MAVKVKISPLELREEIKKNREISPVRIILTTPELSAKLALEAFEKDGRHPYVVSNFTISEGFLREKEDGVKSYGPTQLKIALHAETIKYIDIVLPKHGYGYKKREASEDALALKEMIEKAIGKRAIKVSAKVENMEIDYSKFDIVIYQCVDYRFFLENVSNLILEKGMIPLVISSAGAVAILKDRVNPDMKKSIKDQIIRAFKLSGAKLFLILNHGNQCGGYKNCGCSGAEALSDVAIVKEMATKILKDGGFYGVQVVSRYQTLDAYYSVEFRDIT
ncbi:TPA: hypothetical protein DDW69_04510 [candidate division CPR2 bacterium]|uniref:Uncharacterized protein n=1 Tax=candidate division CPR2 bacterium GW2011_GWC1_41_48 TaxID=1618344 RepID=A0A0G0YID8_UNCC2|nr:MAG: hypothetical protein UT47_C0002G0220 [candidate division CPR2 bacterium GW2011_GWC2_39_35]KKR29078.1 MAG: hypothetical protein UT60_C0007G0023 [candidate division CPR2 bacterium GW2011_GWD2_39_7]KKS09306.1 MAG: hypothetical protein UU65_C0002G0084 [candidate division CPR2 bacterium GW2011_GWC1_41_48]OGB70566.1 MAG: hypothetical protein A2Y26_04465 [candidate division CPR2 bacterium GWD2_39_7]HBG82062.1 hypothetical protein [candidate division CPR2 bacterium]